MKNTSNVTDQESLAKFILDLANDHACNGDWANNDLKSFLYALSGWVEDMDGYYNNNKQPFDEDKIPWKIFAEMLSASTVYE